MRWPRLALLLVACGPTRVDSTSGTTGDTTAQIISGEFTTDAGLPTTSTGTADPTDETSTGHIPTGQCLVAPQTHDACPDPCPLTVDVEIVCDDPEFGVTGVRVAASPDRVWLATAGVTGSYFHAAGPDETHRIELPTELTQQPILLATAPSGELHLAARLNGTDAVFHLTEASDWQPSQVVSLRTLLDLEVDPAGAPHLWSVADPDSYFEAVRVDDTWTEVPALAPEMALQTHFGLTGEGTTVGVGTRFVEGSHQLSSRIVDESQDLGAPTLLTEYRLAPLAGALKDGPDVVCARLHDDGLRVAWQAEPGLLATDAAPLAPMCPVMILNAVNCPTHCHDTAVGIELGAFMIARTVDGRGWLAHLTTHLDHEVTYTPRVADVLGKFCDGVVTDDHGAGVLHLYELGFDGAQPIERLTLPIAAPAVRDLENFQILATAADRRALDLRAFGSSLALGLRTRDSITGVIAVRLLRFETAQ